MARCVWCGRSKKLFEKFNKYGFCEDCKRAVRNEIEGKIARIQSFLSSYDCGSLTESGEQLLQLVDGHISTLDDLEELRKKVPMFKSSTAHLYVALLEIKKKVALRLEAEARAKSSACVGSQSDAYFPSSAEGSDEIPTLTIPKMIDHYELRYLYRDVFVVGIYYANPDFCQLNLGDAIDLVPAPENKHDKMAVKVMCNNQRLGYLAAKRDTLQSMVHSWVKKGRPIFSAITTLNEEEKKINIVIGFYIDQKELLEKCETIIAKLTKTNKKDESGDIRQENLQCLHVGDALSAEYDWETETYLVTDDCCFEMGELGKSISAQLQEVDEDYFPYVVVDDISEDDDCKRTVRVKIYLKPRIE